MLCLLFAGCSTAGKAGKERSDPADILPGGCSVYLAGGLQSLPAEFSDVLIKKGIPAKIIKKTERIVCCVDRNNRITVLFTGDYSRVYAGTYFSMKKQYKKCVENNFEYFMDQVTHSSFFLPDKFTILYTDADIKPLLSSYPNNPQSFGTLNRSDDFSSVFSNDIFIYMENPKFKNLDLNVNYSLFILATYDGVMYVADSAICFDTEKDAKVISLVVKLFLLDAFKKYNISGNEKSRNVSVEKNRILIKGIRIPADTGNVFLEFFVSEIDNR